MIDTKALREAAQAQIDGGVVARMIAEFAKAFDGVYSDQTIVSMFAVGPMQSFIGYAIQQGHLRVSDDRLRTEADVRVRALEWRTPTDHPGDPDPDDVVFCVEGIGGLYAISRKQQVGPERLLWWAHDSMDWTGFDTIAEAKAAAQADYEKRIRAALQGGDNE